MRTTITESIRAKALNEIDLVRKRAMGRAANVDCGLCVFDGFVNGFRFAIQADANTKRYTYYREHARQPNAFQPCSLTTLIKRLCGDDSR